MSTGGRCSQLTAAGVDPPLAVVGPARAWSGTPGGLGWAARRGAPRGSDWTPPHGAGAALCWAGSGIRVGSCSSAAPPTRMYRYSGPGLPKCDLKCVYHFLSVFN